MARDPKNAGAQALKVLILSASTGNGHMSAAYAVEAELKAQGHDAKTVDVLDHTGRGFRGWYRGGYEILVRKKPKLWGHLYKSSDKKRFNYYVQTGLDLTFVSKMRRFMARERPDWVVCTHSLPQPMLARWRKRMGFKVAIVVTDLYPQLMWLRGTPDWFFVPGDWSKEILEKRYPRSKGRITVTGIPADARFAEPVSKPEARQEMNLDPNLPTILVTSGGIGGGPIGAVVSELKTLNGVQFVIVCGRSEQALAAAKDAAVGSEIIVKGQVSTPEMATLMHAADMIVAKPGGITTFEALAAGVPFVVFDPFLIPGQEEKNAEFLVAEGIGVRVGDAARLKTEIQRLLADTSLLTTMSVNARKHSKVNASRDIVAGLTH